MNDSYKAFFQAAAVIIVLLLFVSWMREATEFPTTSVTCSSSFDGTRVECIEQ